MKYKALCWLNDIWYEHIKAIAGVLLGFLARVLFAFKVQKAALKCALAALRYGRSKGLVSIVKLCVDVPGLLSSLISQGVEINEAAARSIILKWPTIEDEGINKGVILVTFTRTFTYFLRAIDLEKMSEYFIFVLEPSWSGYADPDILGFVGRVEGIVVEASEIEDRMFLSHFPQTFVPVSFGAGDWVDISVFTYQALAKKYDSIYVANTNPIKRVKRYLEAVKNIVAAGHTDYFGCLVCASWGAGEHLIKALVGSYQLEKNIELKFSLSREQIIEVLNSSKVNILLSYKEGSNRSLFESMFCDTPVICIGENIGVNKAYINEFTGLLVADEALETSLVWIRDHYRDFSPRQWALQHIAPDVTTQKLNVVIRSRVVRGSSWYKGELLVKTNNPEVSYLDHRKIINLDYSLKVLNLFALNVECTAEAYTAKLVEIANLFENDINCCKHKLG